MGTYQMDKRLSQLPGHLAADTQPPYQYAVDCFFMQDLITEGIDSIFITLDDTLAEASRERRIRASTDYLSRIKQIATPSNDLQKIDEEILRGLVYTTLMGKGAVQYPVVHVEYNCDQKGHRITPAYRWTVGFSMRANSPVTTQILDLIDARVKSKMVERAGTYIKLVRLAHQPGRSYEELIVDYTPPAMLEMEPKGPIAGHLYIERMLQYLMAVNPSIVHRSMAYVGGAGKGLIDAGLNVIEHWIPKDTSSAFARYLFSDGVTTYCLDYAAPILEIILSVMDEYLGVEGDDSVRLSPITD